MKTSLICPNPLFCRCGVSAASNADSIRISLGATLAFVLNTRYQNSFSPSYYNNYNNLQIPPAHHSGKTSGLLLQIPLRGSLMDPKGLGGRTLLESEGVHAFSLQSFRANPRIVMTSNGE